MDRPKRQPTHLGLGKAWVVSHHLRMMNANYEAAYTSRQQGLRVKPKEERRYIVPRIKIKEVTQGKTNPNAAGKSYSIVRVKGTFADGDKAGMEWNTQFFANKKDLKSQTDSLNAGDLVDVSMTKNGNFWNPTAFTKVEQGDAPSVVSFNTTAAPEKPVQVNVAPSTEPGKLDYIRLGMKAIGTLGKMKPITYVEKVKEVADLLEQAAKGTGPFQFGKETKDGIPDVDDAEESNDNELIDDEALAV